MSVIPPHLNPPIDPAPRPFRFAGLLLVLVVFFTFIRLCGSDFTYWDDQGTIYENPLLNPPTLETFRFYWTTPDQGLFVPVTYTAWALLAKIAYIGRPDQFGIMLNPWPFHTASVIVHIVSAILVLNLLRRLVGAEVPALLGALFFSLHPLQVETIGWVSGFKDMLCWCFGLASLLVYVRRVQTAGERRLWASWELPLSALLLALAILSKPTAMVIPAAMWLLDGLLLRRQWRRSILPLLPHVVLAAIAAALAREAQYVEHVHAAALWQRPFVAGDAIAFYIRKILWPASLAFDYGRTPRVAMSSPLAFVSWIVPASLVVAGLWLYRRTPIVAAAVGLFLVGVAPVSGLATFQMQNYSTVTDHYVYFALLGPALALAWALKRWPSTGTRWATVCILVALAVRSFFQTATWHDSYTLFEHAIAVNPRSYLARTNLAITHLRGTPTRPDLAEPYADEAYALDNETFFVIDAYASVKARIGKKQAALDAWRRCEELLNASPRADLARSDYRADVAGNLIVMEEYEEALGWATRALKRYPNSPKAIAAVAAAKNAIAARDAAKATTQPATTPVPSLPPASMPARADGPG